MATAAARKLRAALAPGFLSRHPPAAERVAALRGAVAPAAAPPPTRLTRLSRAVLSLGQ